MILGQLASVARSFAEFYAGTRKLLQEIWPLLLEKPIDLFPMSSYIATRRLVHNGGYIQKPL